MPTLNVRALDATTGRPLTGAAVTVTPAGSSSPYTSGFTDARGDFYCVVPSRLLLLPVVTYLIVIAAKGYNPANGSRNGIGNATLYYTAALTPTALELATPLTYPIVVGTGTAPDLLVTLPTTETFDEVIVSVAGAFPSVSRSPVPPTGPVIVPLAARLLVAPPTTLTLISHSDRFRRAPELSELYTLTVTVRQGNRIWPVGTLTTTALLVDLTDLEARLEASPWLSPWPGAVPIERGGYSEVIMAVPLQGQTYNLFVTAHENGVDGSVAFQDTLVLSVPVGPASYAAYRVRLPDYSTPAMRLLLAGSQGNLPPLWATYRTF